jgi:hypothetical protein
MSGMSINPGVEIMMHAIQALCALALAYGAYLSIFVAPHCGEMPRLYPRPGRTACSSEEGRCAHEEYSNTHARPIRGGRTTRSLERELRGMGGGTI